MKAEVKVRPDKERGLFSTKVIKKGEMVCIMPIDYIQLDGKWYSYKKCNGGTGGTGGTGGGTVGEKEELLDFRYGIVCEIQKISKCELDDFTSQYMLVDGTRCSPIFRLLKQIINKYIKRGNKHSIIGVSNSKKTKGWFIGHMINDYETMLYLTEHKYEQTSNKFSNVIVGPELRLFNKHGEVSINHTNSHTPPVFTPVSTPVPPAPPAPPVPPVPALTDTICSINTIGSLNSVLSGRLCGSCGSESLRLGLKIVASKNINKGDELYLSYGHEYWKKYSSRGRSTYSVSVNYIC